MDFRIPVGFFSIFALVLEFFAPSVRAQPHHFAPAPAPTSDGMAIDQAIAYGLMLLALILTYLVHAFDAPVNL